MAATIDEEGGRAGDAAEVGAIDILGDAGGAGVGAEGVREAFEVESELLGVAHQIRRAERALVAEQEIVHFPEGPLVGRGFGGFRGELGARADVVQRQMAPDVADVHPRAQLAAEAAEIAEELPDDWFRPPAVRAFEVAVLDNRDRSVDRPTHVVTLRVDVDVEVDKRLGGSEEGADPQPSGQQRRGPEQQPGDERRPERGAENAELRLLELAPVEGECRDQQRDREADSSDRTAAGNGSPAYRRPQPSPRQARQEPRAAENANGLADDVADQDPERYRRAESS